MQKNYDIIIFGATGFTGRLVAEYLQTFTATDKNLRWAMAGRSIAKLEEVRSLLGIPATVPLIKADASDAAAMSALVKQAKVIITTVGPYQRYGEVLATACAHEGTDYVELCGEPAWMAQMIAKLQEPAKASGARIVFSCGFDSIPFDLGVVFLQNEAQKQFHAPATKVNGRVRVMKGGVSGGTIASAIATIEQIALDPVQGKIMTDPFALTPGFRGPRQPNGSLAAYDPLAQCWTGPFVMAVINTKNVHRTNALLGHAWGTDFTYDERMTCGDGESGQRRAVKMQRQAKLQTLLLWFRPTRALLRYFVLPKPGEGPTLEQRTNGSYDLLFIGEAADKKIVKVAVTGDRDPGYGSTAKMISQAALCLAQDVDQSTTGNGVWTPGSAMGVTLIQRLEKYAGLTFKVEI